LWFTLRTGNIRSGALAWEKRGSFSLQGSNWFLRPVERSEQAWRADVAILMGEHQRLSDAVLGAFNRIFWNVRTGSKTLVRRLIAGIALHDVYHAGQISLIKKAC